MMWSGDQHRLLSAMGYVLHERTQPRPDAALSTDTDAPLRQALSKAAGGRDLTGLALPAMAQLRRDPAAKRALWPLLRGLRKLH